MGWSCVALLVHALQLGPPTLPPLPGQRGAPEPEPVTEPESPATPQPNPAQPTPSAPRTAPKPAATGPTAGAATLTPGVRSPEVIAPPSTPGPASGTVVEPPQPEASAGPPVSDAPAVRGPGAAPTMDRAGADRPGELPGSVDQAERPVFRLPPPKRPPYSGTGLFIGAGATLVVAIAEQIVAHILVKRRCIDPIAADLMKDPDPVVIDPDNPPKPVDIGGSNDELGDIVAQCAPGVVPALALRVHSDLGLLATIGLATAGGSLRGRRHAWDGVFANNPHGEYVGLRAAGIALIGTGVVTWFSSGAASWAWLAGCDNARCANRARLLNFTMRDVSALMAASGGALLAFAETHRRATGNYERDKALSVGVGTLRGGGSLQISGRF